jgi:hypothetical protein
MLLAKHYIHASVPTEWTKIDWSTSMCILMIRCKSGAYRVRILQQLVIIHHEPWTEHLTTWLGSLSYINIPFHFEYSMCRYVQIKSVAALSNLLMIRQPLKTKLWKSIAVKLHVLAIPSAEQARESLGHGDVKSNHLSQAAPELTV